MIERFDMAIGGMPETGCDPADDDDVQQEWALLELAVDAIRSQAIADQVRAVRTQFELSSVPGRRRLSAAMLFAAVW
jgi:hypothetical protein